MTLKTLIKMYRSGEVTDQEALQRVAQFLTTDVVEAEAFVDEIIGKDSEVCERTDAELQAATQWEMEYRSRK